jgi:hypothetical protein
MKQSLKEITKTSLKIVALARKEWLLPVILATLEAEFGRITVSA